MVPFWRLPFTFDPDRLQTDLTTVLSDAWVPHFNTGYYQGDWSGISLRSVGGVPTQLYPDPTAQDAFADTEILKSCNYFQEVLKTFQFPLEAVRLLRLSAGSSIREHKDYNLGIEDGTIRIHVPILTNPDVRFFLREERIIMNEGESWYVDFNLPHRVENLGTTDRIHLVIDGLVNDWVLALFAEADIRLLQTQR